MKYAQSNIVPTKYIEIQNSNIMVKTVLYLTHLVIGIKYQICRECLLLKC